MTSPVEHSLRIHAYSRVMRTGELPDNSVQRVFGDAVALLDRLGHKVSDANLPFAGPTAMELLGTSYRRGCSAAASACSRKRSGSRSTPRIRTSLGDFDRGG